jgi:WD40 repeat protein
MVIQPAVLQVKQAAGPALVLMFLWISLTATPGQTVDSGARARQSILHLKTTLSLQGKPKAIDLSPDGKTIAISVGDAVQLWDLSNGELVRTINGFSKGTELYWSPDSTRLLITPRLTQAVVWMRAQPSQESSFPDLKRDGMVSWSPDSKHIIASESKNTLVVWDGQTLARQFELHLKSNVTRCNWSPDGRMIMTTIRNGGLKAAVSPTWSIQVWDAQTGKEKYTIRLRGEEYNERVEFSADGKYLLTTGSARGPSLWDTATGNLHLSLNAPGCRREWVCTPWAELSRAGTVAVAAGLDEVDVWEVASGKHNLTIRREARYALVNGGFSSDGRLIALYQELSKSSLSLKVESSIGIYDTTNGQLRVTLVGDNMLESNDQIVWSHDSQTIVTAGGSHGYQGKIWDVSTGTLRANIALIAKEGHTPFTGRYFNDLDRLSFHPSLPLLIGTSNEFIKFWDSKTGELLQVVACSSSVLSDDGKVMAMISDSGNSVQVWQFEKE